ncbi:MAG: hypothetical protein R3B13_25955 [Polyangiaceae bacterium]
MTAAPPIPDGTARRLRWATVGSGLLALLALAIPKVGLPAAVVVLITLAAGALRVRSLRPWAIGVGVVTLVAFIRFAIVEAVPGVVQGGNMAASNSAVHRLREIVFAQDVMRQRGFVDPDGDHIGSAALLGELSGELPLRGVRKLDPPLLARGFGPFHDTPAGPAAQAGAYLFLVCLPGRNGAFTANPKAALDDEAAERRFLAYAWPMGPRGPRQAYAVDQHEAIFVSENGSGAEPTWAGPFHAPTCDALTSGGGFRPWRGKKPRATLPGDVP